MYHICIAWEINLYSIPCQEATTQVMTSNFCLFSILFRINIEKDKKIEITTEIISLMLFACHCAPHVEHFQLKSKASRTALSLMTSFCGLFNYRNNLTSVFYAEDTSVFCSTKTCLNLDKAARPWNSSLHSYSINVYSSACEDRGDVLYSFSASF